MRYHIALRGRWTLALSTLSSLCLIHDSSLWNVAPCIEGVSPPQWAGSRNILTDTPWGLSPGDSQSCQVENINSNNNILLWPHSCVRDVGSLKEKKKKERKRYPNYSTTVLEPVSQWVADIKLRDEFLIFCYLEKGTEVTSLRNPEYLGRIQFSTFAHFFLHIAYRHKRWVASCWRSPSELSRSHRSLLSHDSSCSSPPHPDFIFSCAMSTN